LSRRSKPQPDLKYNSRIGSFRPRKIMQENECLDYKLSSRSR
jgi:hypothetical protein